MIESNEKLSHGAKAKWEAPQLDTMDANLADVKAAFNPGTDSLMFGGSSSMS